MIVCTVSLNNTPPNFVLTAESDSVPRHTSAQYLKISDLISKTCEKQNSSKDLCCPDLLFVNL